MNATNQNYNQFNGGSNGYGLRNSHNSYQDSYSYTQHDGAYQDQDIHGSQRSGSNGSQPSLSHVLRVNTADQQHPQTLNPAALSPIQSWDAKDLLHHWGRVQEAKSRREVPPVMRIEDLETTSSREGRHSAENEYTSSEDENNLLHGGNTYAMPLHVQPRPDEDWRYDDIRSNPLVMPQHAAGQLTNPGHHYNQSNNDLYAQPFWQRSSMSHHDEQDQVVGTIGQIGVPINDNNMPTYSTVNRRPTAAVSQV